MHQPATTATQRHHRDSSVRSSSWWSCGGHAGDTHVKRGNWHSDPRPPARMQCNNIGCHWQSSANFMNQQDNAGSFAENTVLPTVALDDVAAEIHQLTSRVAAVFGASEDVAEVLLRWDTLPRMTSALAALLSWGNPTKQRSGCARGHRIMQLQTYHRYYQPASECVR